MPVNKRQQSDSIQGKQLVKMIIRLPIEMHEELRTCSFHSKISMAELCREGIEVVLQKYQKKYNK